LLAQLKVGFPNRLSIDSGLEEQRNPSGGLVDKAEEMAGFRAYLLLIGKRGQSTMVVDDNLVVKRRIKLLTDRLVLRILKLEIVWRTRS
jgi:hypothetical protein